MLSNTCLNCLFSESCIDRNTVRRCSYYSPIEDVEPAPIDKEEFYSEWVTYVKRDEDIFFSL